MRRTTIADLLEGARRRLHRLSPERALDAQRGGAVIVDTRSHHERARDGVIPGSLHLPRSVLEWRLDPDSSHRNAHAPSLDALVILVCTDGYSSTLAAVTLQELGFARATDVVGGFTAWQRRGLPVAPAPEVDDGRPGMAAPLPA